MRRLRDLSFFLHMLPLSMFNDFSGETGRERNIFLSLLSSPYICHTHACAHSHSQIILPALFQPFVTHTLAHSQTPICTSSHNYSHTHQHFFWMIKSEESDHSIMWEMCFSDIIEMSKKVSCSSKIRKKQNFPFP